MATVPIAVGLTICDYVIFEAKTQKPSLVGCFSSFRVRQFPGRITAFSLFSVLTDGSGEVTMEMVITRLDTGEEIGSHQRTISFSDPLAEAYYHLRVSNLIAPVPGTYHFMLTGNGEWLAQRRLRILAEGEKS